MYNCHHSQQPTLTEVEVKVNFKKLHKIKHINEFFILNLMMQIPELSKKK